MGISQSDEKAEVMSVAGYQNTATLQELVSQAYEEYRDALYRYFVILGADPSVSQDLTQAVFLELYVAMGKGKQIHNARAWMFTVASHLAINHFRTHHQWASISGEDLSRWLKTRDQDSDPEKAILEQERAAALQRAMGSLSPQEKICLRLRTEGLRYREIAKTLGVSVPTVAEFLRRAISKLRRADL